MPGSSDIAALSLIAMVLVGPFAAGAWAAVAIRRTLRWRRFAGLSARQRPFVWAAGAVAFLPSLFIASIAGSALINLTLSPGPWVGLQYMLTVTLSLAVFGYLLTWAVAFAVALAMSAVSGGKRSAASDERRAAASER